MLVGQYSEGIYNLNIEKDQYSQIKNCSWMLQWDNQHIVMNNEYNNELYIVNTKNQKITPLHFDITQLSGPVYLSKKNNKLYVACYGRDGKYAGVCVYTIQDIQNVQNIQPQYITLPSNVEHHIHCVNQFNDKILAIDLGGYKLGGNIYELTEKNNQLRLLYNFGHNIKPRHFIPINNQQIAVITESLKVGCFILSPSMSNEKQKMKIDKQILFNHHPHLNIKDNITGAEIKFYKGRIYVSIRKYKNTFDPKGGNEIIDGIIVELDLQLNILRYFNVGKEPRYFNIKNDIIYVTNQESNSITEIHLNKKIYPEQEQYHPEQYHPEQEQYPNLIKPNFILFEEFTNNLFHVEKKIQQSIHRYKSHF
jgi:hypothetical protein